MKYEVYFQSYHEGEMWRQQEFHQPDLRITKVWDGYLDNGPLTNLGISQEITRQFFEQRVLLASNRSVVPESFRSKVLKDANFDEEGEADVFLIAFDSRKKFAQFFELWLQRKLEEEPNRGADDGTYDYYPDVWFVAKQLAEATGLQKIYNDKRQELFDTTDYGEDEELRESIEEAK